MPLSRPAFPGSFREKSDFEKVPLQHGAWVILRLNLVECWFRDLIQKRLRRGAFPFERALREAILAYIDQDN